jgi:hypothetical protein
MLSSRKTHNLRRLTTIVHAKELEQPPPVALGSPVTGELKAVSAMGIIGKVSSA